MVVGMRNFRADAKSRLFVCFVLIFFAHGAAKAQYYNNQEFNPIATDNNNNLNINNNLINIPSGLNSFNSPSVVNYPQQQQSQSFYNAYNPTYFAPSLQTSTYNICPEPFYFFDYDPLIMAIEESSSAAKNAYKSPYEYDVNSKNKTTSFKNKNVTFSLKNPRYKFDQVMMNSSDEIISSTRGGSGFGKQKKKLTGQGRAFQSQVLPNAQGNVIYISQMQMQGPVWQILRQTYEKCCPLNRNRLRPTKLKDELDVYQELLSSFSNQTNVLYLQSQGMYGLIELFNDAPQGETNAFSAYTVQILSSNGFYLISKRELNGSPTITPIALSILLNCWPMLVILLLANAYAAIFIWFLNKVMKTHQMAPQFVKGTAHGLFWSFFLFTATSLAPGFFAKKWAIRVFTVLWMMICLVIVVIFISMFTSSLTIYAINGQSLQQKMIGINRYSSDRVWLELENAVAVEYNSIIDMFRDLDKLKLDYMLLDQTYVNFYSKLIVDKFYVMRQVSRKVSYNYVLRGFNKEQLSCFRTTAAILSHQWLKTNLSSNANKIRDTSKYFNITDELLFPQRNVILITAVGILIMIIIGGISWQITCMKSPGLSSGSFASGTNRRMRGGRTRSGSHIDIDTGSLNGNGGGSGGGGGGLGGLIGNIASGHGGGGGGGRGISSIGRSLFNQTPIGGLVEGVSGLRSVIGGGLLSQPSSLPPYGEERSVKFNPLVHNFYFANKSLTNGDQPHPNNYNTLPAISSKEYQPRYTSNNFLTNEFEEKYPLSSNAWNYYRMNDSANSTSLDDTTKETPSGASMRPMGNTSTINISNNPGNNNNNNGMVNDSGNGSSSSLPPGYNTMPNIQNGVYNNINGLYSHVPPYTKVPLVSPINQYNSTSSPTAAAAAAVAAIAREKYFTGNNFQMDNGNMPNASYYYPTRDNNANNKIVPYIRQANPQNVNRLDLYNQSNLNNNSILSQQQYKFKKFINRGFHRQGGILLAPVNGNPQSIYQSQESNTDDNLDGPVSQNGVHMNGAHQSMLHNGNQMNHPAQRNHPAQSPPPMKPSSQNSNNPQGQIPSITVTVAANDTFNSAFNGGNQNGPPNHMNPNNNQSSLNTVNSVPNNMNLAKNAASASLMSNSQNQVGQHNNNPNYNTIHSNFIKELPRNESFYLTEFSSVKL